MKLAIIIFITLSIMGAASWILPTKRERRLGELRMNARQLKLTVQLTSIGLPDKWDKSKDVQKFYAYCLFRDKPLDLIEEDLWLISYEVWKYLPVVSSWWMSKELNLTDQDKQDLLTLSGVATAIKINKDGVSVYWDEEKGDEDTVKLISRLAHSLAKPSLI